MGRYNKQNLFNQTLKKQQIKLSNSYNSIVANLLHRVNFQLDRPLDQAD